MLPGPGKVHAHRAAGQPVIPAKRAQDAARHVRPAHRVGMDEQHGIAGSSGQSGRDLPAPAARGRNHLRAVAGRHSRSGVARAAVRHHHGANLAPLPGRP